MIKIFIKALRIRTIQDKKTQKIEDVGWHKAKNSKESNCSEHADCVLIFPYKWFETRKLFVNPPSHDLGTTGELASFFVCYYLFQEKRSSI